MVDQQTMELFLDSLKHPFIFADMNHVVRYMNKVAVEAHAGKGVGIGCSLFDCHKPSSKAMITTLLSRLEGGEEEILISESPPDRIYMRGVRNGEGRLIGYYERFEPTSACD